MSADSTHYSSTASVQYVLVLQYNNNNNNNNNNNEANKGTKGEEKEASSGADWIHGENECAVCDDNNNNNNNNNNNVYPITGHEGPEGE